MSGPPSWISMEPFVYEGDPLLMTYHRYRAPEKFGISDLKFLHGQSVETFNFELQQIA